MNCCVIIFNFIAETAPFHLLWVNYCLNLLHPLHSISSSSSTRSWFSLEWMRLPEKKPCNLCTNWPCNYIHLLRLSGFFFFHDTWNLRRRWHFMFLLSNCLSRKWSGVDFYFCLENETQWWRSTHREACEWPVKSLGCCLRSGLPGCIFHYWRDGSLTCLNIMTYVLISVTESLIHWFIMLREMTLIKMVLIKVPYYSVIFQRKIL